MTKLKAGLVAAVIVTGVVAAWLIQRQAQKQLEAQVQELRAKSRQVDSFVAENARLSNRLAQAEAPNSLGQEQLAELLRLRGEVGSARQQASELKKLQVENRRLRAAASAGQGKAGSADAKTEELDIRLAKAEWAFAGYGTPEAALQSLLWARREGDFQSVLGSLTPAFLEQAEKTWGDRLQEQLKSELPGDFERVANCRISKKEVISENEVKLFFALMESPQPFGDTGAVRTKSIGCGIIAKRVGNDWKLEP
jgi:hypothetical protein